MVRMSFSSLTFNPYLAIFTRSYSTFIWGKPAVFSTTISAAPDTPEMAAPISWALSFNISRSSPKTLMAKSALTPVMSSLKRISIGWVNSSSKPAITAKESLKAAANSSLVSTVVHSFSGLKVIMTSLSSMDMGSVGISAAPIRLTTWSTSGNFSNIFSISVVMAIVLVSVVPVFNTGWITKSPSLSVGINSPPILEKTQKVANKIAVEIPNTTFLLSIAQVIAGW